MIGLRPAAALARDRPHGCRMKYLGGCHCFRCRRANSDYERQRQAARAAGDWNGIVDAVRARTHILYLSRIGIGRRVIADTTDISSSILCGIRTGKQRRIRARTERKILGVNAGCRADHSFVPADLAWRLIDSLLEEGFTKARLAKELGYKTPALQLHRTRIYAKSEQRVVALHYRLMT